VKKGPAAGRAESGGNASKEGSDEYSTIRFLMRFQNERRRMSRLLLLSSARMKKSCVM
jgi:hypothetical protein